MQVFMSPSTVKSERRRKSRNRPPRLVYVELPNGNGGMMRDLSEEGFAVRAMIPLAAGGSTYFAFSLGESIRIEGEGKIVWSEENGRVAGVQFTQIASTAREQILNWLSGPQETPEREEIAGKPAVPPASVLEQLREEIRSIPRGGEPPEATPDLPTASAQEMVPAAWEVSPTTPPLESAVPLENVAPLENRVPPSSAPLPGMTLPRLHATSPGGKELGRASEDFPGSTATPVLPPLASPETVPPRRTPPRVNSSIDAHPASPASARDEIVSGEPRYAFPPRGFAEKDVKSPQPPPPLPDISKILIQPSGRRPGYSPNSTVLEPLPSPERFRERRLEIRTDRFTLSHAFAIMILLTMVAAVLVFHREVGQSLVWLGGQLGGTQVSELQPPAPNNGVSTEAPIGTPSSPPNSPTQERSAVEPPIPEQRSATGTAAPGNNSQAPLSAGAKRALPPVTPLSGIPAPPTSNEGPEAGQTEYAQAMQILRGKSSGADQSEVVRLLWISVEKGNLSAELALAEMYWYGMGVARNCDQTRILLNAAARKGSAEAQKWLQDFQRQGCE
jgi:hypothetical protein